MHFWDKDRWMHAAGNKGNPSACQEDRFSETAVAGVSEILDAANATGGNAEGGIGHAADKTFAEEELTSLSDWAEKRVCGVSGDTLDCSRAVTHQGPPAPSAQGYIPSEPVRTSQFVISPGVEAYNIHEPIWGEFTGGSSTGNVEEREKEDYLPHLVAASQAADFFFGDPDWLENSGFLDEEGDIHYSTRVSGKSSFFTATAYKKEFNLEAGAVWEYTYFQTRANNDGFSGITYGLKMKGMDLSFTANTLDEYTLGYYNPQSGFRLGFDIARDSQDFSVKRIWEF